MKRYTIKQMVLLFVGALLVRGATFFFYVQHHQRYRQADSTDYHNGALCMALDNGMFRIDSQQPIFWRTPGYPLYLSWFYAAYGVHSGAFEDNTMAQKSAIWVQIILCSLTPILAFFLALSVTSSVIIAWTTGILSAVHLGFVLGSCYLLTDALALVFFLLFCLLFYQTFHFFGSSFSVRKIKWMYIAGAAINLALYTWFRPNGQFIALVAACILLCSNDTLRKKIKKIGFFLLTFFTMIVPWYVRNYQLTGYWFFCPMFGPYLHAFCAPRILETVTGKPLDECMKYMGQTLYHTLTAEQQYLQKYTPDIYLCKEMVCGKVAWPICLKYPLVWAHDWIREVCTTTFDLYASQLVKFVDGTYTFDPPREYLSIKLAAAVWTQSMPLGMRLICWTELLLSFLLWIGLLGGFFMFVCRGALLKHRDHLSDQLLFLWIKIGMLIGPVVAMSGGYGYARLRMPVDVLMIILALTFWYWVWIAVGTHKRKFV